MKRSRECQFVSELNKLAPERGPPELVSVTSVAELSRRPSRPADYASENLALVALAKQMAAAPESILQTLADTALTLCRAHSSGLSLLEDADQMKNFHWRAIAGEWRSQLGGGTPRNFGPCGTVLDRNTALLFSHPERDFPYFGEVKPLLEEGLLIPFYIDGEAVGTIWIVSHDASRRFDLEDLRVMTSLATFSAAAYQTVRTLHASIRANRELHQSASAMQRLAAIVASSDNAIISKDLDGIISSWNRGAERLFGYTSEEMIGKSITILMPPDHEDEEPRILDRIRNGERIESYDTLRRRKDGSVIDVSLGISPIKDMDGKIVGASKIAHDITERKRAAEQLDVVMHELSHRTKNLLSVIQAMAQQTARHSPSIEDFLERFNARIQGVAASQDLLVNQNWRGAPLEELVRQQLLPFVGANARHLSASGPPVKINSDAAQTLGLALHELATNASKYGALSVPEGRVAVRWMIETHNNVPMFRMTWQERGGPPVGPTDHKGFGRVLIERVTSERFGATASLAFEPQGVTWTFEAAPAVVLAKADGGKRVLA